MKTDEDDAMCNDTGPVHRIRITCWVQFCEDPPGTARKISQPSEWSRNRAPLVEATLVEQRACCGRIITTEITLTPFPVGG